jgi:predicted GNAT family acetyltransferase
VAGYAVLRVAPLLAVVDGPALHIDHLFVQPSARRHGVARGLLSAATAIAERQGAEQILASAAPSARDTHRFLARLGFSPMVVRRAVGTASLRRRLAGEGRRSGLEDLLSRRRSLRARALRAGWVGAGDGSSAPIDDDAEESCPDDGPVCLGPVVRLDLQAIETRPDQTPVAVVAGAAVPGAVVPGAMVPEAAAVPGAVGPGAVPSGPPAAVVGPPRTPESMPIGSRHRRPRS